MAETQQYVHDDNRPALSAPWTSPAELTVAGLQQLTGDSNDEEDPTTPISPMMSRRASIDSDRFSSVSGLTTYFPSNPTNVNPKAQYVASFGASQVVSEHLSAKRQTSSDEDDDEKLHKDDVRFTEGALALANAFLDQLLYSLLSSARSTSLLALRPAVTEVLKHRLARDAITSADEELAELLAGGDDDDEEQKHKTAEESRRWDLELVWKRTRLRVMVYMRLGEMEDEDEQRYVKEEELFHGDERRFSSSGLVSWAAAIFLTSILEYIAELVLQVAGKAAYDRARRQSRTQRLTGLPSVPQSDVLVVEEYDVEKIALNSTLGRLWRTWRKSLRNNAMSGTPTHRSQASRDNMFSAMSHRRSSFGTANGGSVATQSRSASRDQKDDGSEVEFPEHVLAANIPLPIGDDRRDVDEIVVPGLVADQKAGDGEQEYSNEPYPAEMLGSLVALPMSTEQRDVDEIEVPGLARDPDEPDRAASDSRSEQSSRRLSLAHSRPDPSTGLRGEPSSSNRPGMLAMGRQRSTSLPTLVKRLFSTSDRFPDDDASTSEKADQDPNGGDSASQTEPESRVPLNEEGPAEAPPEREDPVQEKSAQVFPWMSGAAVAIPALGAGAVAAYSQAAPSAKNKELEATASDDPISSRDSSRGLTSSAYDTVSDVPTVDEHIPHDALLHAREHSSQRSFSDEEVEELDRRKSLIDIKAMMIVNGPSGSSSRVQSPQAEESSFLSPIDASHGGDDMTEALSEEEGPEDAIGVARSADVPSTIIPRVSQKQEARGTPHRPSRLVLDSAPPVVASNSSALSPDSLQRQFSNLTSESGHAQAPYQTSPTKFSNRVSLATGAQQPPAVEKSPHRQSFTADVEKSASKPQSVRSLKGTGQKMHSAKNSEGVPYAPKSPRLVSDSDSLHAMTSSSIRGPEDFDTFLQQGGDTVKYTLTPETVRDDSGWSAPVKLPQTRQAPVEMDATSVSTASTRVGRNQAPKHATSASTVAGGAEDEQQDARRRSMSKPPSRNTSTHRKSGLMAREPRVQTDSTRDFADFIRSTAPQKERPVKPLLPNASQTSLHSLRSAHINGAAASRSSSPTGDRSRSNTVDPNDAPAVPPLPPAARTPKKNMQPRAAKATTMGSSDLIDFIRSGPNEDGQHRISRTVAPFRNTMDSDQLKDLTGRASTEQSSSDARLTMSTASYQSPSMRSSVRTSANSQSALLNGPGNTGQTVQPVRNNQPPKLSTPYEGSSMNGAAQNNEPTRKEVRNKDPYSMDFLNDDDDDDWFSSVPKSSRGEESMADFLNNNEPPQDSPPRPLLDINSPQARDALSRMTTSTTNGQRPANVTTTRSNTSTPAQPMISGRPAGSAKMLARGGTKDIAANSNTRELADFLRASGPDEPGGAPAPFIGRTTRPSAADEKAKKKAEKKSAGGFFTNMRRSHTKKATYLDMP